jgi:hypothetical protein
MSLQAVLLPVFVQVALTFALLFWLGPSRVAAVRRGEVRVRDIAMGQQAWPKRQTQIGNAYHNQLQLPVFFYVLVALTLFARKADLLFVLMSWVFVLLRLVHAWIHVTTNRLPGRFYVFLAGAIVLLIMWIVFAIRVLLAI